MFVCVCVCVKLFNEWVGWLCLFSLGIQWKGTNLLPTVWRGGQERTGEEDKRGEEEEKRGQERRKGKVWIGWRCDVLSLVKVVVRLWYVEDVVCRGLYVAYFKGCPCMEWCDGSNCVCSQDSCRCLLCARVCMRRRVGVYVAVKVSLVSMTLFMNTMFQFDTSWPCTHTHTHSHTQSFVLLSLWEPNNLFPSKIVFSLTLNLTLT